MKVGDWQGVSPGTVTTARSWPPASAPSFAAREAAESAAIKLPAYAWLAPGAGLIFTALALTGAVPGGASPWSSWPSASACSS